MPAFLVSRVDVTPGSFGSWVDVDVSASVPTDCVCAFFEVVNTGGSSQNTGWRKKGSTDTRTQPALANSHFYVAPGLDDSRICQFNIESSAIKVYLYGAFHGNEAVSFTNAIDKSLSVTLAWTDIDISADTGGDTAIAAIIEHSAGANEDCGYRKKGSTDTTVGKVRHIGVIIGVDGSEIFQANITSTSDDTFLTGYILNSATFNTNAVDRSLTTTGSYATLSALSATACGAVMMVQQATTPPIWNLRKVGNTNDDQQGGNPQYAFCVVPCNGNYLMEGIINNTNTDFFEVGWFPVEQPIAWLRA